MSKSKTRKQCIMLLLLVLLMLLYSTCATAAAAASTQYTDVMDDLSLDSSFNAHSLTLLPSAAYGLNVFQIAESSDGELFVYVSWYSTFAPDVTSINMSLTDESDVDFHLYYLQQLSTYKEGVITLGKFVVKDFSVIDDDVRYYNIASIYRKWYASTDSSLTDESVKDEVSYAVAKVFVAATFENSVVYSVFETNVVEITDKYVGNLMHIDNLLTATVSINSYVAFSTDYNIDELFEVQVSYVEQHWTWTGSNFNVNIEKDRVFDEDTIPRDVTWKYTDVTSYPQGGIFSKKYSWTRIQSVNSFRDTTNLGEAALAELEGKDWVILFDEQLVDYDLGMFNSSISAYDVTEVTILRLKFSSQGTTYNLGVVDDKRTGSSFDNVTLSGKDFWKRVEAFFKSIGNWLAKNWWVIPVGIVGIVLVIVIAKFGLTAVLQGLWLVISWPFKAIAGLFKKGGK